MTFDVLAVRSPGELGDHPLYPLLNEQTDVVLEPLDGPLGPPLHVSRIVVRREIGNSYTTARSAELDFQVWITASRVIISCKKFEKGGTWVGFGLGGLAAAAIATGVSHAVAAGRRKGKALVGHVRYPWVSNVLFRPQQGRGRAQLRLGYVDGTDPTRPACDITLDLDRSVDANRLARHVADLVVAYRYAADAELDAEEIAAFEALRLSGLAPLPAQDRLSSYRIPSSFRVPGGLDPAPASVPGPVSGPPRPRSSPRDVPAASEERRAPSFCVVCGSAELGPNFCTDCGAPVEPIQV